MCFGHQDVDIAALDFIRAVAKQPLGRAIERGDGAAVIDHHDSIYRGI